VVSRNDLPEEPDVGTVNRGPFGRDAHLATDMEPRGGI
jgi:hypothetical protein